MKSGGTVSSLAGIPPRDRVLNINVLSASEEDGQHISDFYTIQSFFQFFAARTNSTNLVSMARIS